MVLTSVVGAFATSPVNAADGGSSPTRSYHFDLTKGAGTPVCDAYLQRLNTTVYASPPYCGRPETTTVPGFTVLHRVPLSAEEVHALYPRISLFMQVGRQGSRKGDVAHEAKLKSLGVGPGIDSVSTMRKWLENGEMKVWRYEPPVDIDNDGISDKILLWQGRVVSTFPGICGTPLVTAHLEVDGRQPTLAFLLSASMDSLDTSKTMDVFGHLNGGYRLPDGTPLPQFRPIGPSIGIFGFDDLYYFDTYLFDGFIGSWGRLNSKKFNPHTANNLGVFLRRDSKTTEVCEYHMTAESFNSRGEK